MTTLPTGEQLPEYDDDPMVNPDTLRVWLQSHSGRRWGQVSLDTGAEVLGIPEDVHAAGSAHLDEYERLIIADVLQALQAVGGATLVKNPTYRAMVKDRADLERIGAALIRAGRAQEMAVHGVVGAAVKWIDDAVALAEATAAAAARLRDIQ